MNLIKKISKRAVFNKAALPTAVALVVFLLSLGFAYFAMGKQFPLVKSVWRKAAEVLPLPAASINGQKINLAVFETAKNLGANDPYEFVIKVMAVKILSEQRGLNATNGELLEREQRLLSDWRKTKDELINDLKARGVSYLDFQKLFIETDILREKLAAAINVKNDKVVQVENQLRSGVDFGSLATRFSDDLFSAPLGGDVGFVDKSEIDPAVWQRALSLNQNEWAGPISTLEGFVFVKKLEEQPATADLPHRLRLQLILIESTDFEQWLEEQIKQMDVKIFI